MFGLSAEIDLSFVLGRAVQQVCLGTSQVQLHFSRLDVMDPDDVSIYIESGFVHVSTTGVERSFGTVDDSVEMLASLLRCGAVNRAWREPPGTLCLGFDAGDVLKIRDDSEQFESYQIKHGDQLIVV